MSVVPEEERFATNIKGMSDLLYELISAAYARGHQKINPQLITMAGLYISGIDKTVLIDTFITHTYTDCWDQIRRREDKFFIENASKIFGKLPIQSEQIDAFKYLFTTSDKNGPLITEEDKTAIFDIASSLVKIAIKYTHRKRCVELVEVDGVMKPRYKYNFMPEIKVRDEAKKWGITLDIPQA